MANNIVNRNINIFVESGQAEQAYNRLIEKEKVLKQQLDKATDPAVIKKLKGELDKLSEPIDRAAKKMSGQLQPSVRELEQTFQRLRTQVRNFDGDQKSLDALVLRLQKANIELTEAKRRTSGLQTEVNKENLLTKAGAGASDFLGGLGGGILFGGAAAAGAATIDFLSKSIDEAAQAEKVASELKNTLSNLGKVDAFERLSNDAQQLADKLGFIDNDDLLKVQQKLLTYGKLTEKQINDLLPVITDFAVKTGQDLPAATEQIIGALEGNGKALKQYGINIKDGQSVTERFGIVMTDLKSKVEGAAEAFGDTKEGSYAKELQKFKNLQEEVGNDVGPIWNKIKIGVLQGVQGIITGLKSTFNDAKDLFDFYFRPETFAKNAANKALDDILGNAREKANSFVGNLSKATIGDLEKELQKQGAILRADSARMKQSNSMQNNKNAIESAQIVLALQTEIKLRKERNALADKKDKPDKPTKTDDVEAKKKAEDFAKLIDELAAKARDLQFYNAPQLVKDLDRVNEFYNKLEARAQGNAKVLKQIDELRNRENFLIVEAYQKAEEEKRKKLSEEQAKKQKALDEKRLREQFQFIEKLTDELSLKAQKELGEKEAGIQLKILKSKGKEKLKAQQEQLNFEKEQAIAAAGDNVNEIGVIEEEFRQAQKELLKQYYLELADKYIGYANTVINAASTLFNVLSENENRQLERDREINDQKKKNLEGRLKKGIISQQQYNAEVSKLDAEQEKKEREIRLKQFKRDKAVKIATTIMNTAQAVVAALASPWPASLIFAALAGAVGAAQLGIIASQKPPEFAKGGYLNGPSHGEGGMPVINPRTGRKEAEVEGGEVILSRSTVRNNPNLVGALLHSSMNRGGATIQPAWKDQPYTGLNVAGIRQSQQSVRMFETGGVFPGGEDNSDMLAVLGDLSNTVNGLKIRLDQGIMAYSLISQQERQQNRLNDIRNAATIK